MNLFKMKNDLIQAKENFRKQYQGLGESQYNKLDYELHEEYILEMQEHYINMCNLYNDLPCQKAMAW